VKGAPREGRYWFTLGVVHYRNGHWKQSVTALSKSVELSDGDDSDDWFFLAMAHWQRGDKEQAWKWYSKAVRRAEKTGVDHIDPCSRDMHAEAARLLGSSPRAAPKAPSGQR
jgi:uncharacterized protein HemY